MKIPFLDLKVQYHSLKQEIDKAVLDIFENTSFILGKPVSDFETAFSQAHGLKHTLGVSTGTDGNHMALWALGVGHGDEVIMPANTFIATAWGATLCGAVPVFVDCEKDSYNIDPVKIEAAITPKTKAIVAVHLYGQPADMDALKEVADKHKLFLVEDCAQAHIAEYKGKKVGGLSAAASFSFYPGKNLGAFGEGGAVTTNDDTLAEKFKMLREHGSLKKYHHEIYGHNYRMEAVQGAVLNIKLKKLEEWTEKRRAVAQLYNKLLADVKEITIPEEMPYAKHVYHLYVIQSPERDVLQDYLNESGVATGLHYPIPLHLQNCFKHLGYSEGSFPVTEKLASQCLSLPIFPELKEEQVEYVCVKIKEFYKK
jgi:dTDP-4-amino-4,6-dideoxygalactose transaminase